MISDTKKVIDAYSDPTWLYDIRGFLILTFAYQDTIQRQIRFFSKNIKNEHAEIAVGSGTLFSIILRYHKFCNLPKPSSIHVSDYVPSMLASAQKRFACHSNITVEIADLCKLPYRDNQFNSVNIANSMHCIHYLEHALHEVYRVLKPGGTFASNTLTYPREGLLKPLAEKINQWGTKKGILHKPYTPDEMRKIFSNTGFIVLEELIIGNVYYALVQRP